MPALALTFDDGPDPVWTPRLLDVLRDLDARVTFFPIAPRATAHPDLIARIQAEGHSIGLHCDEHVRHNDRDEQWVRRDTERGLERLTALGVKPTFWRTPWGDTTSWSCAVARDFGLRLIGWTVDTHDWRGDQAQDMFDATRADLRAGTIVLAHDGVGPGSRRSDAKQTLAYVKLIAPYTRKHGLSLKALS